MIHALLLALAADAPPLPIESPGSPIAVGAAAVQVDERPDEHTSAVPS